MKKLTRIIIIIVALFQTLNTYSQTDSITSGLYEKLENIHIASEKVNIYIDLSKQYKNTNINKAINLANSALNLAEKTNTSSSLGLIYSYLGEYALLKDSIEYAEQMFKNAADYLNETSSSNELITVYLSIGNRYIEKDNYAEALKYYLKGIEISENSNDHYKLANLSNNLGIVYLNINNPEKALKLYSKALSLFEEEKDSSNVAGTTTNIGSIYLQLGQFNIAETYYKSGYRLFNKMGNKEGMAHSLLKLGLLEILQYNYDSAQINLSNSLTIQKELEVTYSGSKSFFIAETYINLGIAYLNLNSYTNAKKNLLKGYTIAKNTEQWRLIALSAEHLGKFYKKNNELGLALDYYQTFKQYSDSANNEESIRRLTQVEMQHQFNTRLKEDELEREILDQKSERRNLVNIIIIGGLFFLLAIAGLLLRLEKTGKRRAELERASLAGKLEHTNKELATHVMYLLRKNEFIITIAEKLKKAKLDAKTENKKILSELIKELESNSTMVSWEEFEIRFQEVYTGYYKKLNLSYPDLTPNELRLCAFFKLNMTTKEIAAITYQSTNSIVVARYRLRKKLGLEKEDNLVSFLAKI